MPQSNVRLQLKVKTLKGILSHFQKRLQNIRKRQRTEILRLRSKENERKMEDIRSSIKNIKK